MALCKFRHLVPVQYSYPSASVSSSPHTLRRYFVCGALAEASSSGELEKATQASKQEATEVSKTEEANSSHNPRSTLNETKRHRRKVKTKSQSFKVKKGEIVESWETSGVKETEWLKEWVTRKWVNVNKKTKQNKWNWSSEARDLDSKEVERSRREPQSRIRKGRTRLC